MTQRVEPDRYSMVIEWEPQGGVYVVTVPELPGCRTHGRTLEEAVKHGQEVTELWLEAAREDDGPIPPPRFFDLDSIGPANVRHFTMTGEDDDDALPYQERTVQQMVAAIRKVREAG
jgi:predicted RNase H-like HicB family nuclease